MRKFYKLITCTAIFFIIIGFLGFSAVSYVIAAETFTVLPSSDGFYAQWTPKSGTVHYAMVDESTCNGNTDFNSTTTIGARDSYGIDVSNISNGSTITQIDITPCASKNTSGGSNSLMNVFYRVNNINSADSGNYNLTGTTPSSLTTTSFSGLSITKSASTSVEIGTVLTTGRKGAKLGRIAAAITYTPLTSPSNLGITGVTQTQATLSWTDNSLNENGFAIERSSDGVSSWFQIGTTSANITTYIDTGLTANTAYYYRIQAYNSGGNSGYSNINGTTTFPYPPTVETNDATDVISITESSASATLNSTINPNGASTFGYYRYGTVNTSCDFLPLTSSGFNVGSGISDISPNSKSLVLFKNTTYYYCAVAYNSGGISYGNVLSFTTP